MDILVLVYWLSVKVKTLLEYTNAFSASELEKNDKILLKYFQKVFKNLKWKKSVILLVVNIKNLKAIKYHKCLKKQLFVVSVAVKMKRYLKKKNQLRY